MDINASLPNQTNNLPTTLDITPLLSKLKSLQPEKNINHNQKNIRLIELDSHSSSGIKTRLFLAAVYSSHYVVCQPFALELTNHEEEYEWNDASDRLIEGGAVVVFPCVDSTNEDVNNKVCQKAVSEGVEITSCALVPTPAVRVRAAANEHDGIVTRRTVAVAIGTCSGHVFSTLLHVSLVNQEEVKFKLQYERCKSLNDEAIKSTDGDSQQQPTLQQILPQSKIIETQDMEALMNEDTSLLEVEPHVTILNPSTSSQTNSQQTKITSISYARGEWRKKKRGPVINPDVVWVIYDNGTIVKLPSWKLFVCTPAECHITNSTAKVREGDSAAGGTPNSHRARVIPVENSFVSPLDVPPSQLNPDRDEDDSPSKMSVKQSNQLKDEDYWELLMSSIGSTHGGKSQALVLGDTTPSTLPMSVQSSRVECTPMKSDEMQQENVNVSSDQQSYASSEEEYGPVTGTVVGGIRGALGVAIGAVRWGFGGAVNDEYVENELVNDSLDVAESVDDKSHVGEDVFEMGSSNGLRKPTARKGETLDLLPWPLCNTSLLFSDVPRRFDNAVVDPSGSLVATTDNLGRVILFDLETHQMIRMWKGMRNVSLHFAELPCDGHLAVGNTRSKLYLVIHALRRGTIEVYRLRQGPRVAAATVPDQNGCFIVECTGPPSDGSRVSSFLYENVDNEQCILDYIVIDDTDQSARGNPPQKMSVAQGESSMHLTFLIQLLAPDTNVQCTTQTILNTFNSIRALSDLGEGLDVISKSQKIEQIGAEGATFHSQVLAHCKSRLEQAVEKENREGSGMLQKSVIASLSSKIAYHEKLIKAYDVLHRYEVRNKEESAEDITDYHNVQPLSEWASEAISWISVAEEHGSFMHTKKQREDISSPLAFSKFASLCISPNPKSRGVNTTGVYLTEIKRDRLPILVRVFQPLLEDLFVFKVVNSVFSKLGIDQDTQQQYFGEWFMTLASYDVAQSNLSGTWRPVHRWLQDLITGAYDAHQKSSTNDVALKRVIRLQSLLEYCMGMEDLTKAFLLAVICMDAVSVASKQIEEKTYGKITQRECTEPWEILLRKLRVLLLISFRLRGDVNPPGTGINPFTVKSAVKDFSTYFWIARDELSLSHDNQVLMALESACLSSSVAFYPSSADGDKEVNRKIILQSCSFTRKNSILSPSGLTDDPNSRPLLFYFKDHAKCTAHLAAHRALILGSIWGQTPSNTTLLNDAVSTLHLVVDKCEPFSLAIVVEFYQSWIRSIVHAMMFGFIDGHGTFEEIMSPLIEDGAWRRKFLSAAKRVVSLIIKCIKNNAVGGKMQTSISQHQEDAFSISKMWPPLQNDPILGALTSRFSKVCLSSVELHHTILFAYELTGDTKSLESISPAVPSLFSARALFTEMAPMPKASKQQYRLLDGLLVEHAKKLESPVVNRLDLDDIEIVGKSMGIDKRYVLTRFFVETYRLGKDSSLDDLLALNIAYLDKRLFLDEVVHIVCQRLDATLASLKKSKSYRGVVSVIDAHTSRWIREEAAKSPLMQKDLAPISLIATHSLVHRTRTMSGNLSDETLEKKIAAISMMSETLLKAVQSQEKQNLTV